MTATTTRRGDPRRPATPLDELQIELGHRLELRHELTDALRFARK